MKQPPLKPHGLRPRWATALCLMSALFADTTAQAGLVAHWTFDTNGNDATTNNYHLTLKNGAAISNVLPELGAGSLGGAAVDGGLDGTDDRAEADGSAAGSVQYKGITGNNPRAISVWVKGQTGGDPFPTILSSGYGSSQGGAGDGKRFDVLLNGDSSNANFNRPRVELNGGGINAAAASGVPSHRDGIWHHIVVTFESPDGGITQGSLNNVKVYSDGKLVTTSTNTRVVDTDPIYPVVVGDSVVTTEAFAANPSPTLNIDRNFRGWIDDLAIYDDAALGDTSGSATAAQSAAMIYGFAKLADANISVLPSVQSLWAGASGASAMIAGKTWYKATNIPGAATVGLIGGSLAGNDAYIKLTADHQGLALFPNGLPDFDGYGRGAYTYTQGNAIAPLTPGLRSTPPTSFSVSPALPNGLTLNTTTGVISGTPTITGVCPAKDYTITANYPSAPTSVSRVINITVRTGFYDGFEGRVDSPTTLNDEVTWDQTAFGDGGVSDYRVVDNSGNPLAHVDVPAGVDTSIQVVPTVYDWDAGKDFYTSLDIFISDNINWGGLAFGGAPMGKRLNDGFETVGSFYTFEMSDGTGVSADGNGDGPTDNFRFAFFEGGAAADPAVPVIIKVGKNAEVVRNRWYRLIVSYKANTNTFNLLAKEANSGKVVYQEEVVDTRRNNGAIGMTSSSATNLRMDNFYATVAEAISPYKPESIEAAVGVPMSSTVKVLNAPAANSAVNFTISPALPSGFNLNPTTGEISGTPSAVLPSTFYTVTAIFSNGAKVAVPFTLSANISEIRDYIRPERFDLLGGRVGVPYSLKCILFGKAPTSLAIVPPLPAGLGFNTTTGEISGTPTAVSAFAEHTVTATYGAGEPVSSVKVWSEIINTTNGFYSNFNNRSGNFSAEVNTVDQTDVDEWLTQSQGSTGDQTNFIYTRSETTNLTRIDGPTGERGIATLKNLNLAAGQDFHYQADLNSAGAVEWYGLLFAYTPNSHWAFQISDDVLQGSGRDPGSVQLIQETIDPLTEIKTSTINFRTLFADFELDQSINYRVVINYTANANMLKIRIFDLSTSVLVYNQTRTSTSFAALSGQFGLRHDFASAGFVDNIAIALSSNTPAAAPVFTNVSKTGGTVSLSWSSTAGKNYEVQSSSNLQTGGWTVLQGSVPSGGATTSYQDTTFGTATQKFYRVRELP
jgi:hypothetical protein